MGDYKHWTRDPRTKDPTTQGPEDKEPKDQGPNDLALLHLHSFYDRNATCDNVLSSNVWLYHCGSQSLHCYTHSSSHQIVLFHTIC